MSAASASLGATTPTGQAVPLVAPAVSRPNSRKRSLVAPKPSTDAASDVPGVGPLLPPSRGPKKGRDVATTSANGDVGGDLALLSHPKDLSHSLHGEHQTAATQQSKQKTIALPGGKSPLKKTVRHTLHKEAHIVARRRPSSIWDITGHFFSRLFIIFILGAGLGTSIWNYKQRPQPHQASGLISTEVEKLEDFVAKTTKWMQVQLEVVDMKIGQEVSDLRKELHLELDSQQLQVSTEVKTLKDNLEKIGAALDSLFSQESPLTKKEALDLIKDVVDKRAAESQGQTLSLDDVRAAARQVVMRELERHSADGIGRVDYALGSGGGRVIAHSEGYFLGRGTDWRNLLSIIPGSSRRHPLADKILQPSFGEPGQCLPLKGSNVWIDISLRTTIRPDAITLEHVSKDVAYDVSSAPKEFSVFGWRESRGQVDRVQNPITLRPLGEFKYDIDKPSVQTFALAEEDVAGVLVNVIRLHVSSNHGSQGHTCIYRVRVHGSDPTLSLTPSLD